MTCREVDDLDGLEPRDLGEHGVSASGQVQHLRARDRTAHQGGRDGGAGVVGQLDGLSEDGPRLGDRPGAEPVEDLGAQAVEARLLREEVERRSRNRLTGAFAPLCATMTAGWSDETSCRAVVSAWFRHPARRARLVAGAPRL